MLADCSESTLGLQLLRNVLSQAGVALRQVPNPHAAHLLQQACKCSQTPPQMHLMGTTCSEIIQGTYKMQ